MKMVALLPLNKYCPKMELLCVFVSAHTRYKQKIHSFKVTRYSSDSAFPLFLACRHESTESYYCYSAVSIGVYMYVGLGITF